MPNQRVHATAYPPRMTHNVRPTIQMKRKRLSENERAVELKRRLSQLSKQCRRKADEEGYAALMNNTKWRELCLVFARFEKAPLWRTYDFLSGYLSQWDSDWYHHVGPDYCSIEWLEIDPHGCSKGIIREALHKVGVPFEETEHFKVIGYKK